MTVHTSISHPDKELSLDQKHTLQFEATSHSQLETSCTCDEMRRIVTEVAGLFELSPPRIQLARLGLYGKFVLCILFHKKNKCQISVRANQNDFDRLVDSLAKSRTKKRPEEKLKFIFKRCLKHLLRRFAKTRPDKPRPRNSKTLLREFYVHHYTHIAHELGLSLEEFLPPNRSRSSRGASNKTLNLQYLAKLARNPDILAAMIDYMEHSFVREYQVELKTALDQLVPRLTELIHKQYLLLRGRSEPAQRLFQRKEIASLKTLFTESIGNQVQKELVTASRPDEGDPAVRLLAEMKKTVLRQKMKIPWTLREVQAGIAFVKKKLARIQKNHCKS